MDDPGAGTEDSRIVILQYGDPKETVVLGQIH
jgi:hypothetical protein